MYWHGIDGWASGWSWAWGMMGLGVLFVVLFWAVLILGIAALIKWLIGSSGGHTARTALEILKERYVRGEVTREQFEQMKRDIDA